MLESGLGSGGGSGDRTSPNQPGDPHRVAARLNRETSLSIIGRSVFRLWTTDGDQRRAKSIAGCCHLLAERHNREGNYYAKYQVFPFETFFYFILIFLSVLFFF